MLLVTGGGNAITLLAAALTAVGVGLFIFLQSFLLTRHTILRNSTCHDFGGGSGGPDCWVPRTYNRVVLLLIDGLRHDFCTYHPGLQQPPHYLNKMPVFQEILNATRHRNPSHKEAGSDSSSGGTAWRGSSFLAQFVADAPTTTMQRLKALVTGGLPTFIDVANNFDSPQIEEDSLVRQLELQQRYVSVLGDDTWAALFPNSFVRSFLFPSFNVRDLDTVDNGVLQHLQQEVHRTDTQLVVAHFLGVDHAGHRFGPDHPRMQDKLRQLNDVVRQVAGWVEDDTLLVVAGDHGMTPSGDHGGDSSNEVTAGLFVYSPGLKQGPSPVTWPEVVQQVSLAPTLALLLGVPAPYSSVGAIVPQLFGESPQQLAALSVNVQQVHRFLAEYHTINKFPVHQWQELLRLKLSIERVEDVNTTTWKEFQLQASADSLPVPYMNITDGEVGAQAIAKFKIHLHEKYLTLAKVMCEEVWATFDVSGMVSGLLLMIVTIGNLFCIVLSLNKHEDILIYFAKGNTILMFITLIGFALKHFIHIPVMSFIPSLFSGVVLVFHVSKVSSLSLFAAKKDLIPIAMFLFVCCGNFSNSFIVYEDSVIVFTVVSLFVYQTLRIVLIHKSKTFDDGKISNLDSVSRLTGSVCVLVLVVSCLAVRWTQSVYRCREEQQHCNSSTAYLPLSSIPVDQQNYRYNIGLAALFLLTYLPRYWLTSAGNLNGTSTAVIVTRYAPVVSAFMIAAYWALESVAKPTVVVMSYINYPARAVYAILAVAVLLIFAKPLMIFQLYKNTRQELQASTPTQLIPELFNSLKNEFDRTRKRTDEEDNTPVVYGLATGLSAPLLAVNSLVLLTMVMILGDGLAGAVVLLVVVLLGWLLLHSVICWHNPLLDSVMRLRWINPIAWVLLSLLCFYGLGHQTAFETIPWSAAFTGFVTHSGGSGNQLTSMLLVLLHTYAGHLLLGLLLPLLAIAPLPLAAILPALRKNRSKDDLRRGEFILVDRPEMCVAAVTSNATAYLALHCTKVLCSCLAGLFLRRHLMMWKVFAQHLVFEVVGLLVTVVAVLLGLLLAFRALGALHSWATDITLIKVKPL